MFTPRNGDKKIVYCKPSTTKPHQSPQQPQASPPQPPKSNDTAAAPHDSTPHPADPSKPLLTHLIRTNLILPHLDRHIRETLSRINPNLPIHITLL